GDERERWDVPGVVTQLANQPDLDRLDVGGRVGEGTAVDGVDRVAIVDGLPPDQHRSLPFDMGHEGYVERSGVTAANVRRATRKDGVMTTSGDVWPAIPVAEWADTRDTLHLYTQVVGKVRLASEPHSNHWWNVPLYLSARGLTTSLMPHPSGPAVEIEFDFVDHRLDVTTVAGESRSVALVARPVAEFYALVMDVFDQLGVATEIW